MNFSNKNLNLKKKYSKSSLPLIKQEHLEILYGLILGDAHIYKHKTENARIKLEQSIIHEEYLIHLFSIFNYLCTEEASVKLSLKTVRGKEYSSIYFTTRRLTAITEVHNLFYPEGKKIVPFNVVSLLTPVSLAYWVMDDGNKTLSGFILNTHAYTIHEIELLQMALLTNWNIETSLHKDRNHYRIYIGSKHKQQFIDIIKPYIHKSMYYKID